MKSGRLRELYAGTLVSDDIKFLHAKQVILLCVCNMLLLSSYFPSPSIFCAHKGLLKRRLCYNYIKIMLAQSLTQYVGK